MAIYFFMLSAISYNINNDGRMIYYNIECRILSTGVSLIIKSCLSIKKIRNNMDDRYKMGNIL